MTDPNGTPRTAVDVAGTYFRAGADKVSIGSDAVHAVLSLLSSPAQTPTGTTAIECIAHAYGHQAVVVSADPKRCHVDPETYNRLQKDEVVRRNGKAWWYQCTVLGGRELMPLGVVQLSKVP